MKIKQFDWLFFLVGYALLGCGIFLSGVGYFAALQDLAIILGLVIGGITFLVVSGILASSPVRSRLSDGKAFALFMGLVAILIGLISSCSSLTSNYVYLGVLSIGNLGVAFIMLSLFEMCRGRS